MRALAATPFAGDDTTDAARRAFAAVSGRQDTTNECAEGLRGLSGRQDTTGDLLKAFAALAVGMHVPGWDYTNPGGVSVHQGPIRAADAAEFMNKGLYRRTG